MIDKNDITKIKDALEPLGYGLCDLCLQVGAIDRGENFFYIERSGEWACTKCHNGGK